MFKILNLIIIIKATQTSYYFNPHLAGASKEVNKQQDKDEENHEEAHIEYKRSREKH